MTVVGRYIEITSVKEFSRNIAVATVSKVSGAASEWVKEGDAVCFRASLRIVLRGHTYLLLDNVLLIKSQEPAAA